jgi:hypothetical protein
VHVDCQYYGHSLSVAGGAKASEESVSSIYTTKFPEEGSIKIPPRNWYTWIKILRIPSQNAVIVILSF